MRSCDDKQKSDQRFSRHAVDGKGVEEAGKRPCQFIDPFNVLDSTKGPRRPLVVISFDESHFLTGNPQCTEWTLFSQLRRVFREVVDYPIFSLFLSTAASFNRVSPEQPSSPWTRIANLEHYFLPPICEICFDDIAYPAIEHTVSLRQVVEMDWMCHLGRPLQVCFGCYLCK